MKKGLKLKPRTSLESHGIPRPAEGSSQIDVLHKTVEHSHPEKLRYYKRGRATSPFTVALECFTAEVSRILLARAGKGDRAPKTRPVFAVDEHNQPLLDSKGHRQIIGLTSTHLAGFKTFREALNDGEIRLEKLAESGIASLLTTGHVLMNNDNNWGNFGPDKAGDLVSIDTGQCGATLLGYHDGKSRINYSEGMGPLTDFSYSKISPEDLTSIANPKDFKPANTPLQEMRGSSRPRSHLGSPFGKQVLRDEGSHNPAFELDKWLTYGLACSLTHADLIRIASTFSDNDDDIAKIADFFYKRFRAIESTLMETPAFTNFITQRHNKQLLYQALIAANRRYNEDFKKDPEREIHLDFTHKGGVLALFRDLHLAEMPTQQQAPAPLAASAAKPTQPTPQASRQSALLLSLVNELIAFSKQTPSNPEEPLILNSIELSHLIAVIQSTLDRLINQPMPDDLAPKVAVAAANLIAHINTRRENIEQVLATETSSFNHLSRQHNAAQQSLSALTESFDIAHGSLKNPPQKQGDYEQASRFLHQALTLPGKKLSLPELANLHPKLRSIAVALDLTIKEPSAAARGLQKLGAALGKAPQDVIQFKSAVDAALEKMTVDARAIKRIKERVHTAGDQTRALALQVEACHSKITFLTTQQALLETPPLQTLDRELHTLHRKMQARGDVNKATLAPSAATATLPEIEKTENVQKRILSGKAK